MFKISQTLGNASQQAAERVYTSLLTRHAVSPRETNLHNSHYCIVVEKILFMETFGQSVKLQDNREN